MPRKRKAARPFRQSQDLAQKIARLTKWHFIDIDPPADFTTPEEIEAFEAERARRNAVEYAEKTPCYRDWLASWPVSMWQQIFDARPELEDELTPAQGARWQEYRRKQAKLAILPQPGRGRRDYHAGYAMQF